MIYKYYLSFHMLHFSFCYLYPLIWIVVWIKCQNPGLQSYFIMRWDSTSLLAFTCSLWKPWAVILKDSLPHWTNIMYIGLFLHEERKRSTGAQSCSHPCHGIIYMSESILIPPSKSSNQLNIREWPQSMHLGIEELFSQVLHKFIMVGYKAMIGKTQPCVCTDMACVQ